METVQERELLLQQMQGWPFQTMAASFDASSGSCSSGLLLGWEPPFGCFAADAQLHGLFPLCMESLPVSPAASAAAEAVALPPEPQDAVATLPEVDLDDLLLNFWDGSEQQVTFNSTSLLQQHETTTTTTTATSNSFLYGDDDPLCSIFSTGPTLGGKALFQFQAPAEPLLSSSSSSSHADPPAGGPSGALPRDASVPRGTPAPPLPRSSSSSLKRATPEEETEAECSQSSGKRRRESAPAPAVGSGRRVVCPFAVLKPDGLDGGATLADINARMLMRPARPVRHPVGEFACAPRVLSADGPGISGKAVSGFTRLHTPGRGTITIIRTRG